MLQHVALVRAQSTFGSVVGSVKDASGVAAPATLITVRELDENTSRKTATDEHGRYEVVHLKPGHYEITALKEGFSQYVIPEARLEARQT
ncbi:MAG: carboxypeptidase-like regulatory domain-containing protein, partial [Acidobacteria bacterium]|nr:carboxypeptidase-like regulatory domain-containing protein [Acidobacteriota bacterium]